MSCVDFPTRGERDPATAELDKVAGLGAKFNAQSDVTQMVTSLGY